MSPKRWLSDARYAELRQRFSAPEKNYELLNATHPVYGRRRVWDGDYVRQQYLYSVDHLIGVIDGTIHLADREVKPPVQVSNGAPDVVVWLDKSARPASWFVDALWDQVAVPGGRRPRYEFLRIDRRDWLGHMGYSDAQAHNDEAEADRRRGCPRGPDPAHQGVVLRRTHRRRSVA